MGPLSSTRSPARARSGEPVGLAALHYLGVPRNHLHASLPRAPGHGLHDAVQHLVRQALLEDKPRREIPRAASHHGHIVEGAVDRERADVPAGKLDRLHHEGVGGDGDLPGTGRDYRRVAALAQHLVAQPREWDWERTCEATDRWGSGPAHWDRSETQDKQSCLIQYEGTFKER